MFPRNVELLTRASGEEELECIRRFEKTFRLRILINTVLVEYKRVKKLRKKKEREGEYKTTKMNTEKKIKMKNEAREAMYG
jgi:hypothetical protein